LLSRFILQIGFRHPGEAQFKKHQFNTG